MAVAARIAVLAGLASLPACGARATPAIDLATCVQALRAELPGQPPVRRETFERYTRDVTDLRPTIEQASSTQPEFTVPVWDYLARLVDEQREADGRAILERESVSLARIESRHGVEAAVAVAVFGVETDYGRVAGRHPVVDATLSRACLNLSSRERRAHFFAALWLLQEGLVRPESFRGSWAGAFGLTQFMPGTFVQSMDDGDGDGTVDIIGSAPDALATTARYLRGLGWVPGLRWGVEVQVPAALRTVWNAPEREHACLEATSSTPPVGRCRRVDDWSGAGVTRIDGTALVAPASETSAADAPWRGDTVAALLMPGGPEGPAWLVTRNYQSAWRYNRADAYALAIGLLADRLQGRPPLRSAWPTDDGGLSRAEFTELQALLRQRGHCEVTADGRDGPLTRQAVATESAARGLPATGRAGARLFAAMRGDVSADATDPPVAADSGCATPAAAAASGPR
jgi:lytic murein transglycosylase